MRGREERGMRGREEDVGWERKRRGGRKRKEGGRDREEAGTEGGCIHWRTRKCIHMTQGLTAVEGPSQCGITAEEQGTTPRPAVG